MKKLMVALVCVVMMACVLAGCGKGESVASVNGEVIYEEEYLSYIENMLMIYEINGNSIGVDQFSMLKENVVNELINQEEIRQAAKELNCYPTDAEIDAYYDEQMAALYGDVKTGQSMMDQYGLDQEFFRTGYEIALCQQKIGENQVPENTTTDEDAQKIYDEAPDTYNTRNVSHILITPESTSEDPETDEDGNTVYTDEEWEKAYDEAMDIIAKLDKGEDFATLAQENSDDTGSAAQGGSVGEFTYETSQYAEEFTDASFELKKVGEYTKEPVRTIFGYHIIILDDILNGEDDIQSALDKIKADSYETAKNEAYAAYMETFVAGCEVETFAFEDDAEAKVEDDAATTENENGAPVEDDAAAE